MSLNLWDTGVDTAPYCCSFHWLRLDDGRLVGLDVVRSDYTGQLGLRVLLVERDGRISGFNYESPDDQWAPFASDQRPASPPAPPYIGRGPDWIIGHIEAPGQYIDSVRFELDIEFETRPRSSSRLWRLNCINMGATDYEYTRTTGWLEIGGIRYAIDSVGAVSMHMGQTLPSYGYCITIPQPDNPDAPRLLLGSFSNDNLGWLGKLLPNGFFTYSFGGNGLAPLTCTLDAFARNHIPVDSSSYLRLGEVHTFVHELLGVETISATAVATLHGHGDEPLPLGRVLLDYRGERYTQYLRDEPEESVPAFRRAVDGAHLLHS